MSENKTDEVIAVWDDSSASTREIDFYKASAADWIEILLSQVFDEEFFKKFLSDGDHEIPVTYEMLSFQHEKKKFHWYTFSKEIIEIQDLIENSYEGGRSHEVNSKIKFIRRLQISQFLLNTPNSESVEHHIQYLMNCREILRSALTSDAEEQLLIFKLIEDQIKFEEDKRKNSDKSKIHSKFNKLEEKATKGTNQQDKKNTTQEVISAAISNLRNNLSAPTSLNITTNTNIIKNESVVISQPITIIHKNSGPISLMNSQGILRLIKDNKPNYYLKSETSLRFYKWYSSTRCELVRSGKLNQLQKIKWQKNESGFSGEEIAIISRVFLLEKIKQTRRSLKDALDDHHGA